MANRHVLTACWAGRRESVDAYGAHLHRLLAELGRIHPGLRAWRFVVNDREGGADSPDACRDALIASAERWSSGEEEQTAYQLRLFVARELASPAELTITCGVEPMSLGNLFAPNQLTMAIRHDAPDDLGSTAVMHAALAAVVTIFEAEFAHAGSDSVPTPALTLYSPGVPPVGWMTFLSTAYPVIPAKLPAPAVSYPAGPRGNIIVAHPKPFRDHDPSQRRAIADVEAALRHAGVLLPWAKRKTAG